MIHAKKISQALAVNVKCAVGWPYEKYVDWIYSTSHNLHMDEVDRDDHRYNKDLAVDEG